MSSFQDLLDNLPLGTITFVVGLVLIIVGYANGDVQFSDAFKDVLFLGGGSGAIGYVRNGAGKGLKPAKRK